MVEVLLKGTAEHTDRGSERCSVAYVAAGLIYSRAENQGSVAPIESAAANV
jgi:hypothetical protein